MKSIATLFFLLLTVGTQAQVAITDTDLPAPGDLLRYSIPDSFPDLATVLAGNGTGQVWDYTNLTAVAQRKDSFVSVSAVPFSIRFFFSFSANLAQYIETPDSIAGFGLQGGYRMFQTNNAYIDHGLGGTLSGIPIALENNPGDTIFTLPLSYLDTGSSAFGSVIDIPGLVYYAQTRSRSWEVDGLGQLTTPFGTYTALRVHSFVSGRDSLVFDTLATGFDIPIQENYTWYSPDYPGPMLSIDIAGQDSAIQFVSNVSYADSLRDVLQIQLSNEQENIRQLAVYPNPSAGIVEFRLPEPWRQDVLVEVFSMEGRLLYSAPPASQNRIELPGFPSGIYLIRLTNGEQVHQGKLMIE